MCVYDSLYKLIDDGQVVGRIAGDEVIIINFRTGVYYSLTGAGVEMWPAIERGSTAGALRDGIAAAYAIAPDAVEADIIAVLEHMAIETLVQRSEEPGVPEPIGDAPAGRPYAKPALARFDDLADSFAVDPPLEIGG
jgi:hypothetical protein